MTRVAGRGARIAPKRRSAQRRDPDCLNKPPFVRISMIMLSDLNIFAVARRAGCLAADGMGPSRG
jgi:hypothetical protein